MEEKYTLEEAQLLFAKRVNREAWALLEKEKLSADEKDILLYSVFASSYHWTHAGGMLNKQRGEWLISRAYSRLDMGTSALFHAKRCLELTSNIGSELKDFDSAYAFEAMARAYALVGDFEDANVYYIKAEEAAKKIENEKDRSLFISDLNSGDWNGFQLRK